MNSIWITITMAGSFLGIVVATISLIGLAKTIKSASNKKDEEFYSERIQQRLRGYIILSSIGLTVALAMQFIRIFLR